MRKILSYLRKFSNVFVLKRILNFSWCYKLLTRLANGRSARRIIISDYIQPREGDRILDIGCGPAEFLDLLPKVEYHGFDMNPRYIRNARQYYGNRGEFTCEKIGKDNVKNPGAFDIVLASAVLHHLTNEEAHDLFRTAWSALRPNGRLITVDCAYLPSQCWLERFLISQDRGRHVRTPEEYQRLALSHFPECELEVRSDLLRIPYTHVILVATKRVKP